MIKEYTLKNCSNIELLKTKIKTGVKKNIENNENI